MPKQTINPIFLTLIFSLLLANCLPKEQNAGGAVNSVGKYDNLAGITDDVKITIEDTLNNNRFSINLKSDPRLPTFKMVSTGKYHTIAIKTDGTLWAWGKNHFGRLGDGTKEDRISPVIIGTDKDWAYVSVGFFHSVALKSDGSVWAWGGNSDGQLGDGTKEDRFSPVRIGTDNDWASISAGELFTLAIKTDGSMWGWGSNVYGELSGGEKHFYIPTRIGTDNDWAFVSAGDRNSLAIEKDGSLWGWGYHASLNGSTKAKDWVSAAIGHESYAAIKKDGTLWVWGYSRTASGNSGRRVLRDVPHQIGIDTDWLAVSTCAYNTVALKTDGSLWAWGELGYYDYMGGGEAARPFMEYNNDDQEIPVRLWGDTSWAYISAHVWHAFAIMKDGSLWAWGGANETDDIWLGDGTTEDRYTPVQIGAK
jgi:alpha-tubulin suppressor-like RCC1 family protein